MIPDNQVNDGTFLRREIDQIREGAPRYLELRRRLEEVRCELSACVIASAVEERDAQVTRDFNTEAERTCRVLEGLRSDFELLADQYERLDGRCPQLGLVVSSCLATSHGHADKIARLESLSDEVQILANQGTEIVQFLQARRDIASQQKNCKEAKGPEGRSNDAGPAINLPTLQNAPSQPSESRHLSDGGPEPSGIAAMPFGLLSESASGETTASGPLQAKGERQLLGARCADQHYRTTRCCCASGASATWR